MDTIETYDLNDKNIANLSFYLIILFFIFDKEQNYSIKKLSSNFKYHKKKQNQLINQHNFDAEFLLASI